MVLSLGVESRAADKDHGRCTCAFFFKAGVGRWSGGPGPGSGGPGDYGTHDLLCEVKNASSSR